MLDTPPGASAPSAEAVLDAAAKTAAQPQPHFRIVRPTMPDLIATMLGYAKPANAALEVAFLAHQEAHPGSDPVREVAHFDTVRAWCEQHPGDAARIVLCALYLASGRFVAQEENAPPEEAAPHEAPPEPAPAAASASEDNNGS